MELLTLLLFALALNIDAFAAGTVYGMRQIKLPFFSLFIISLLSMLAITLSMTAGGLLTKSIPQTYARYLGGLILFFMGGWFFFQSRCNKNFCRRPDEKFKKTKTTKTLLQIHISSPGLVIQVLREPSRADLDQSGEISMKEAFLLGTALAMDSLGAGFAVSMLGFHVLLTAATVGIGHFTLTYAGLRAGQKFSATWLGRKFSLLPGWILILLGLVKIWPRGG